MRISKQGRWCNKQRSGLLTPATKNEQDARGALRRGLADELRDDDQKIAVS